MVKPALVLLLVAGLLLAATPAALSAETPSASIAAEDTSSSHAKLSCSVCAADLECVEESESSECHESEIFLDGGRALDHAVPAFHLRSAHERNAHRSRTPAVIRGRSPPL
jgi:hypothetical protein